MEPEHIAEAKRLHSQEQITGFIHDTAEQAGVYFRALRTEGFSRAESLALTLVMQTERWRAVYTFKPSAEG